MSLEFGKDEFLFAVKIKNANIRLPICESFLDQSRDPSILACVAGIVPARQDGQNAPR